MYRISSMKTFSKALLQFQTLFNVPIVAPFPVYIAVFPPLPLLTRTATNLITFLRVPFLPISPKLDKSSTI